jgi:hypothetical protein
MFPNDVSKIERKLTVNLSFYSDLTVALTWNVNIDWVISKLFGSNPDSSSHHEKVSDPGCRSLTLKKSFLQTAPLVRFQDTIATKCPIFQD